jgi:hypothetical protein
MISAAPPSCEHCSHFKGGNDSNMMSGGNSLIHSRLTKETRERFLLIAYKYREQGSNLHAQRALDPKSSVSTNSTIPA